MTKTMWVVRYGTPNQLLGSHPNLPPARRMTTPSGARGVASKWLESRRAWGLKFDKQSASLIHDLIEELNKATLTWGWNCQFSQGGIEMRCEIHPEVEPD